MSSKPEVLDKGQEEIDQFQKEADLLAFCIKQSRERVPFRLIEIIAPTLPGWGIRKVFREATQVKVSE